MMINEIPKASTTHRGIGHKNYICIYILHHHKFRTYMIYEYQANMEIMNFVIPFTNCEMSRVIKFN